MARHDRDERDNACEGKVNVPKPLNDLAKHGPKVTFTGSETFRILLPASAWTSTRSGG